MTDLLSFYNWKSLVYGTPTVPGELEQLITLGE